MQMLLMRGKGMLPVSAAAASSSSSSSASHSSGQLDGTTAARAPAAGRERVYLDAMATHPPSPAFGHPGQPFASDVVSAAFARLRHAHNAAAYKGRSPTLIQLVQEGKLIDLGYAIPETITTPAEQSAGTPYSLQDGFLRQVARPGDAPAVLHSTADIHRAFVSTIVPALVNRPEALTDWCALLLSVSEMEKQHGWHAAHLLLTRQLNSAISEGRPLSDISAALRIDVTLSAGRTAHARPSGTPSPAGGNQSQAHSAPGAAGPCRNFNNGHPCKNVPCRYPHTCLGCGGSHQQTACPKGRGQRPQSSGGGSQAGQSRRPPHSGSSVATARDPAPSVAAADAPTRS